MVEFHPKLCTDYYPGGRQILRNLFAIARAKVKD